MKKTKKGFKDLQQKSITALEPCHGYPIVLSKVVYLVFGEVELLVRFKQSFGSSMDDA